MGGAVVAGLVPVGLLLAVGLSWFLASSDEVVVDDQRLAVVEERLTPVLQDLDAVGLPDEVATSAGPADIEPCSKDSGDVIQPSAVRVWRLPADEQASEDFGASPAGRSAARSVAKQLREQGWEGGEGLHGANQLELTLEQAEHMVTATVDVYNDSLYVSASTSPHGACS